MGTSARFARSGNGKSFGRHEAKLATGQLSTPISQATVAMTATVDTRKVLPGGTVPQMRPANTGTATVIPMGGRGSPSSGKPPDGVARRG